LIIRYIYSFVNLNKPGSPSPGLARTGQAVGPAIEPLGVIRD